MSKNANRAVEKWIKKERKKFTFGGLLFGPLTSFVMAFVVSFIEMLTISDKGLLIMVTHRATSFEAFDRVVRL